MTGMGRHGVDDYLRKTVSFGRCVAAHGCMMKTMREILCLACAGFLPLGAWAQENAVESLRPVSVYAEDFEAFAVGADRLRGGLPFDGATPWLHDPEAGVIASEIRGETLSSQAVVISNGYFTWQSPRITLEPEHLATLSLDFSAYVGEEGWSADDQMFLHVCIGDAHRDIENLSLPVGTGLQTIPIQRYLGPFREPTEIQITVNVSVASEGAAVAFDQVEMVRESVAATLPDSPHYHYIRGQVSMLPTVESADQPDAAFEITFASKVPLALESFDGRELYRSLFTPVPPFEFLGAERSDGSEAVFDPPLEAPIHFGFRDGRRGIDADIDLVFDHDVHFVRARYRMARPEDGWEALGRGNGAFQNAEISLRYRPYALSTEAGEVVPYAVFRPHSLGPFILNRNNRITFPEGLEVRPSDPFLDFVTVMEASTPISLESLGDDDLVVRTANYSWVQNARLVEVQEVTDAGHRVAAQYRVDRPEYGWPRNFGNLYSDGTFAINRSLHTTPRFWTANAHVKVLDDELDHVSIHLPLGDQWISRRESTFAVSFLYRCDTPLDLSSFGDGDVVLRETDTPGRLTSLEVADEGLEVLATFTFERKRSQFPRLGDYGFVFPLGSVRNMNGTHYLGKHDPPFTNIPLRGAVRWAPGWETVTADFEPLARFEPAFQSYVFRVRYRGRAAPLRPEDIDRPHITIDQPGVAVHTDSARWSDDGREIAVTYRLELEERASWPERFTLELPPEAIRDVENGSHDEQVLAILGEGDRESLGARLIGGFLIEGDPAFHELSFLVNPFVWTKPRLPEATLLFGGTSQLLPRFDEAPEVSLLEGDFVTLRDFDNYAVITYRLERPESGWDAWAVRRLPFTLQMLDAEILVSGEVVLESDGDALPLLFRFEEWVRQLEAQAELEPGSLAGDSDQDGVDDLTEFALGSDLQKKGDTASLNPRLIDKDGVRHLELIFPLRSNAFGLKAELQHSTDGKQWRAAEASFELIERREVAPGVDELRLCSKEPVAGPVGFYRVVITN